MGKLARARLLNPGGLIAAAAIYGVLEAAGWAINELTGQVYETAPHSNEPIQPGMPYWHDTIQGYRHHTWAAAATQYSAAYPAFDPSLGACTNYGHYSNCVVVLTHRTQGYTVNAAVNYHHEAPSLLPVTAPYAPPAQVSDEQVWQAIQPNAWPWSDLMTDPATGAVIQTPEVAAAQQALQNQLATEAGIDPETLPVVNPNPNPINDPAPEAPPSAWPPFCAWASIVCSAAEWLMETPQDLEGTWDEPVPEIHPELPAPWVSGLGGGSCPPPEEVEVLGASVVFPYDPLCDLAVYIKPIVLAGAALLALFIIGGFRRAS